MSLITEVQILLGRPTEVVDLYDVSLAVSSSLQRLICELAL